MTCGPAPSPYDLHNRLARAEAGLRSVEKALEGLFRRLNVNRKRDPELDTVLEALAAILHGLKHARGDRSHELQHEPVTEGIAMFVEDVRPENDPAGEPEAVQLYTEDDDGRKLAAVIPIKLPEN